MKLMKTIAWLILLLLSACQNAPEKQVDALEKQADLPEKRSDLIYCSEPRPKICMMIYAPVCVVNKQGRAKTYASDCTACSEAEVLAYRKGECLN
ncbi:MAG: hypothetical protein IBX55_12485 [Methyloprofundus sp.]|nr:hypothetical protein [Methyloprofundus sp.]MBW6453774.1 hypothetical protein [Methyloprofundus sp.]